MEHRACRLGVEIAVILRSEDRAQTQDLEQVELDVANVSDVVAHEVPSVDQVTELAVTALCWLRGRYAAVSSGTHSVAGVFYPVGIEETNSCPQASNQRSFSAPRGQRWLPSAGQAPIAAGLTAA